MAKQRIITVVKYLLMLGVGVFLMYLVFKDFKFEDFQEQLRNVRYEFLTLGFIAAMLAHISRAARWNQLIASFDKPPKLFTSFMAVMIGYFANLAIPRMGEVTRCVMLNRTNKIKVDKLMGSVVVERAFDMLCLLFIIGFTLLFEFDTIAGFLSENLGKKYAADGSTSSNFTITNILVGLSIIAVLAAAAVFIYRRFRTHKFFIKIQSVVIGILDGVKSITKLKSPALFIFHTFFIWLMYYMMVYLTFLAFIPTEHLGLLPALTVLVTGSLGFVVPVQGGIGAYHAAVSLTLAGFYGISDQDADGWAIVSHSFQTLVMIILGALSYWYISRQFSKSRPNEVTSQDNTNNVSAPQPESIRG